MLNAGLRIFAAYALFAGAAGQERVKASSYGFSREDATAAVQAAIDSGAKQVTVPYMGAPWIIRPVKLRGDLELIFEPGVLVLAKRGEFKGRGDTLFTAMDARNLIIRGYGATLRMWKSDYQKPPYEKAEWRMGISIRGCRNVLIEGLRIESTGGDGVYIDGGGTMKWSEDVTVRNVTMHDNHRQGMSVISAVNLLVENCVFSSTSGTPPEAGIDLEPDAPDQRLVNCVIRNSVFENNSGHAILIYLRPLDRTSAPVSIRFENCHSRMGSPGMAREDFKDIAQRGWAGMSVGAVKDEGPAGLIEFINCTSENTGKEGARIYDKSARGVRVRFVNCSWKSPWVSAHRDAAEPRVPVLIQQRRPEITKQAGGIDFENCHVYDAVARPAVLFDEDRGEAGLADVTGRITLHGPSGARARLGAKQIRVDLKIVEEQR
jgi:hypothetical protein